MLECKLLSDKNNSECSRPFVEKNSSFLTLILLKGGLNGVTITSGCNRLKQLNPSHFIAISIHRFVIVPGHYVLGNFYFRRIKYRNENNQSISIAKKFVRPQVLKMMID